MAETDLNILTSYVTVRRIVSGFSMDEVVVETSEGLSNIEALGMLRLAEHSVLQGSEVDP